MRLLGALFVLFAGSSSFAALDLHLENKGLLDKMLDHTWRTAQGQTMQVKHDDRQIRIEGFAGCNTYSAAVYLQQANLFEVGHIITTRMSCSPAENQKERDFIKALKENMNPSFENNQLILQGKNSRLVFYKGKETQERKKPITLAGDWEVHHMTAPTWRIQTARLEVAYDGKLTALLQIYGKNRCVSSFSMQGEHDKTVRITYIEPDIQECGKEVNQRVKNFFARPFLVHYKDKKVILTSPGFEMVLSR